MTRIRRVGDALLIIAALILELVVWGGRPSVVGGMRLPILFVPVTVVLAYLLLLLRWRLPSRVFWFEFVFAALFLLVPNAEPFAGVMIAMHAVAARLALRKAVAALVPTVLLFFAYSYSSVIQGRANGNTTSVVTVATLWAVLCLLVWGVGRLSYASVQRELRVHDLELADAVRAERLRLARELHDIVAHSVTLMILQAAGARAVAGAGDERVCRSLSVIEEAGGQAMAELHRLLGLLRSADPDSDSTAVDSHLRVGDVAQLVELAQAAGQQVQLSVDGAGGQLDPSVDLAAFRVVQEGLTNAAKHGAGAATTVRLTWRKDSLHIEICNSVSDTSRDRAAMARLSSGLGVQGLRERVSLVGGTLSAGPVPGGYQLVAELPRSGSYLGQHRAPAGAVR